MKLFRNTKTPKIKILFNQPEDVKAKAITFINTYFPDLMPDIEAYAKLNNTDAGNISAITTKDIILPILSNPSALGKKGK